MRKCWEIGPSGRCFASWRMNVLLTWENSYLGGTTLVALRVSCCEAKHKFVYAMSLLHAASALWVEVAQYSCWHHACGLCSLQNYEPKQTSFFIALKMFEIYDKGGRSSEREKEREEEKREKERYSTHWFTFPQWSSRPKAEPEIPSNSCSWVSETEVLEPSSAAFPDNLVWNWIRSRVAETWPALWKGM